MDKKLFIVFEGIDGAGSSTQAELLKDYFFSIGDKAVISPEPSSGPIGTLIRDTLKQRIFFTHNQEKLDEQLAYLFAADRHDHLYNDIDGIFKLIKDGFHVISTRYYFSSLAYNCQTETQFQFVKSLNNKFPNPDLAIYIDIPIEVSLQRLQERSVKEIYETEQKLIKVREKYLEIFKQYNDCLLLLDGTDNKQNIQQKITNFLEQKFPISG